MSDAFLQFNAPFPTSVKYVDSENVQLVQEKLFQGLRFRSLNQRTAMVTTKPSSFSLCHFYNKIKITRVVDITPTTGHSNRRQT